MTKTAFEPRISFSSIDLIVPIPWCECDTVSPCLYSLHLSFALVWVYVYLYTISYLTNIYKFKLSKGDSKGEKSRYIGGPVACPRVLQTRHIFRPRPAGIVLLLLLALSAWAAADDEFCSPDAKPPVGRVTEASLQACCTDNHCVCDSKICGGENVAIQDGSKTPPPPSDRLPATGKEELTPSSPEPVTALPEAQPALDCLPEPPVPPPPR